LDHYRTDTTFCRYHCRADKYDAVGPIAPTPPTVGPIPD
jgi:hypothetical protein